MEVEWLEYMGMSGRSLDSTAMTPVISSDDEAGIDDPWLPTILNSYESVDRMAEHGNLSSDAHMSSGVDEHDIHAFGRVQPQLPDPSTPVGPGYCCRTNMNRDQWTPSELSLLSPFMPGRRLSIPTGPDITMQKANKKCCSTTSDEPFSTASSVTLQGDNMSQLQSDEEDDDDYDDTNDRHQTLCEQEQELIDDSSDLGETLSQLEIFVDAFYLGGYDAASLPTLIHNICCKITELQDSVSPLDIRLCAMNKEAADLSVTVETINENAKNLKAEIEDMDLSTLLIDLEPYRIFYSRPEAMYTLIRVSVQEDLLHQYPHARSPYKRLTGEYASYSYGGEYSRAPYPCQNCSDDTSLSPAADMHVVPPRHAGWHGPSADHASDHWLVPRPSSTTFPVPGAYLFSPLLPPSHQQPYQLPYHPTA